MNQKYDSGVLGEPGAARRERARLLVQEFRAQSGALLQEFRALEANRREKARRLAKEFRAQFGALLQGFRGKPFGPPPAEFNENLKAAKKGGGAMTDEDFLGERTVNELPEDEIERRLAQRGEQDEEP
jgi:hypothetical protein